MKYLYGIKNMFKNWKFWKKKVNKKEDVIEVDGDGVEVKIFTGFRFYGQ